MSDASEPTPIGKLSVSKLKALAVMKGVDIKGCCEKADIVDRLKAAGVQDGVVIPEGAPTAPPPGWKPAEPQKEETKDVGDDWCFSDPLLEKAFLRAAKKPRVDGPEDSGGPGGLKFFNLKKGEKEKVASEFANRKPPEPIPPPPPDPRGNRPAPDRSGDANPKMGGPRVIPARLRTEALQNVPLSRLRQLAEEQDVDLEGCLDKDDVVIRLAEKGVKDDKPRPKVVPPPPKKAVDWANITPKANENLPTAREYYAKQSAETQTKWQKTFSLYEKFRSKFRRGDNWEVMKGFPLWTHETSREKIAWLNEKDIYGKPTVIQIVLLGQFRMRVASTRWNNTTRRLTIVEPSGWMDVAAVVDEETGKLLMRNYDPHGLYEETETGQEPILMKRRTVLQEKLKIDPKLGAGLHMTATPIGMQVDDIDDKPGQPGLAVGDLIVGINGVNLVSLNGKRQVESAFQSEFVDGAILEIAS